MKIRRYSIAGVLLCFLVSASHLRGDSPTIISEWNAAIQFIDTDAFTGWPGIEDRIPVDVSAEAGRLWLIWPEALVNLDSQGNADVQTLLGLFASAVPAGGEKWSPEGGLICSDGMWRSVLGEGELVEFDPMTGALDIRVWEMPFQAGIYPAPGGNLLVIDGDKVSLVHTGRDDATTPPDQDVFHDPDNDRRVPGLPKSSVSSVSHLAMSRTSGRIAWTFPGSSLIYIAGRNGWTPGTDVLIETVIVTPDVRGMDWVGDMLVVAGNRRLTAIRTSGDGESGDTETRILNDERIPGGWYRIRGGRDRLLLFSPLEGALAIVEPAGGDIDSAPVADYAELLESSCLDAGILLEEMGGKERAVDYYNWVIPQVRRMRSRHPLAESWPTLEKELSGRRADVGGFW